MYKTNPNLGGLGYAGKGSCRVDRGSAGEWNVQNEPNLPDCELAMGDCGLKGVGRGRPTYEEANAQNKPNLRKGEMNVNLAL
jgi:hypothetical protein